MKDRYEQQASLDDEKIVKMITENETGVYEILYKKYWNRLLNFAAVYNNDRFACEEVVQELFLHMLSLGSGLKINSSLSSYLFVAVRNRMFNYLRKQSIYRRHLLMASGTTNSFSNNVEQAIDLIDLEKEIDVEIHQMPEKYRVVYLLYQEDHQTLKKISELLHRPVDTVEKQLRKAKGLLRDHLLMMETSLN